MSMPLLLFWLLIRATQHVFGSELSPNIIFILTDDQDLTLNSMQAMPNVKSLIADKGLNFTNAFANTPVCCPSRTEIVAGRQYHNVQSPRATCQGVAADYNVYTNPDALFPIFHANGYLTGGFGKVTNDWDPYMCDNNQFDLSSFDRVHVSCHYKDFFESTYYNKYVGQSSGVQESPYVQNPDDIYQTAQLGNASVNFIKEQLQKQTDGDSDAKPFFMWVAPYAPHSPADPAPWHINRFADVRLVETPNYNPDIVSGYHKPICDNPEITPDAEEFMLLLYRDRLRSLLAVDDMVKGIIEAVDDYQDAWDNTYVIYASDHGYHIGQYRLPCEKYQPYEETIRIPLLIRGPGVVENQETNAMVSNIDFLPTFLDLANITYSANTYDGRSYKDILENGESYNYNSEWRQTLMFEYKTIKNTEEGARFSSCGMWGADDIGGQMPNLWSLDNKYNSWRVLRIRNTTVDWFYGEFHTDVDANGFVDPYFYEFYDLNDDPYQLSNLYYDGSVEYLTDAVYAELHDLVIAYGECSGADSCSPIGSDRPTPVDGDGNTDSPSTGKGSGGSGKGSGGGKGGKNAAKRQGFSIMDYNNDNYVLQWTPRNVSFGISCIIIVGVGSLLIGYCIGKKIQRKPQVMHIPKDY